MLRPRPRAVFGGTVRAAVALLSVGLLVVTGYAWTTYRTLSADIVTSNVLAGRATSTTPSTPKGAPRQAYTALLVGLDSRTDAHGEPLPDDVLAALHAGEDGGQLHTDTIMLVRVPADPSAPVAAVSFPRDSYVRLADGSGRHKINSAYRRGYQDAHDELEAQGITGTALEQRSREAGRAALVATVEAVGGVTVDHFAEINLAGFVELTDSLGGVPVCLTEAVDDSRYSGAVLPAGEQTVSGATALAFVRQRHGLEGGDLDRITRQQAFLAGLVNRLLSAGTLHDPYRVSSLIGLVARYVVLDAGWRPDDVVTQLRQVSGGDVVFRTIPTLRPDLWTPYDGMAVQVDDDAVRAFVHTVLTTDARANEVAATRADSATPTTPAPAAAGQSPPGASAAPAAPSSAQASRSAGAAPNTDETSRSASAMPSTTRPVIDAAAVPCVR